MKLYHVQWYQPYSQAWLRATTKPVSLERAESIAAAYPETEVEIIEVLP